MERDTQGISDRELVALAGKTFVCDVESFPNYFLIGFMEVESGARVYFEGTDYNRKKLKWLLNNCTVVTFNGMRYDMPMIIISLLRPDYDEDKLFWVTQGLIVRDQRPQVLYEVHDVDPKLAGHIDHIDLIEVAFGKASLKLYGARLHSERLQDLPYAPDTQLTDEQKYNVRLYNGNDLHITLDLFNSLAKQLDLRVKMSDEYGVDLRSKSDSQIAEAVISTEILRRTGHRIKRPDFNQGIINENFKYQTPDFIEFKTKQMQDVLENVGKIDFLISPAGPVINPDYFKSLRIEIGGSVYKMGIGGIHSNESCETYISTDDIQYIDKDVASYYPSIILNQKLAPPHLGNVFLNVYQDIVTRRLKAKREGDSVTNNSLKVTINGSFGKLGSVYSFLYAPQLLIQVTVTGQLSLLMLIEELELNGFSVVSANTDGFITGVPTSQHDKYQAICADWEQRTGFELEDTVYKALYSRDVNNYIAVGDYVKRKGCFRPSDISKNPSGGIIYEAVVNQLTKGVPVEKTIMDCKDPRQFVFVQTVKGGAVKDGKHVGKVVRWYHRRHDYTALKYRISGNKVPKSDGGHPLMLMGKELPSDLNHEPYIREAKRILNHDFSKPKQGLLL